MEVSSPLCWSAGMLWLRVAAPATLSVVVMTFPSSTRMEAVTRKVSSKTWLEPVTVKVPFMLPIPSAASQITGKPALRMVPSGSTAGRLSGSLTTPPSCTAVE